MSSMKNEIFWARENLLQSSRQGFHKGLDFIAHSSVMNQSLLLSKIIFFLEILSRRKYYSKYVELSK
jgi:hypothetical protein